MESAPSVEKMSFGLREKGLERIGSSFRTSNYANDRFLEDRLELWFFSLWRWKQVPEAGLSQVEYNVWNSWFFKWHPVPEFSKNLQLDIHSTVRYIIVLISPRGFSDINTLKDPKGTSQLSTEEVKLYMPRYNNMQDKFEFF